jgi:diguanylate cyclase (GGDEF)-like protein/PAS domain S-box-containing protein
MRPDGSSQRSIASWVHRSEWLQIGMVAFGYIVCARFASLYALTKSGVVVLWLPNAIVLSALLLTRSRQWWKFGITLVVAELLSDAGAFPLWQALGFVLANLFEVLLAAFLIRRLCGNSFAFSNLREVLTYAAIAMGVAPALAALLGTWIHFVNGIETVSFFEHWQIWWIGDGMGMVVLTPLLFGWLHNGPLVQHDARPSWAERLIFAVLLCALMTLVFFTTPGAQAPWIGSPLLLLPLFGWAAMRFGTRGVSVLGCLVSLIAIGLTASGRGMFSLLGDGVKTLVLQQYLAALLLTSLAVAAILNDLRTKYQSLRLFEQAIENMGEGLAIVDARKADMPMVYCNPKFQEITGYHVSEAIGKNCRMLNDANRGQPELAEIREQLAQAKPFTTTLQNFRKNGQAFWNQLTTSPVWDENGELSHFIGIQRDVTDIREAQQNLLNAHAALTVLNQELEQRVAQRTVELERLATTDPLTDAHNRRYLMGRTEVEISQARRQATPLSIVMFDIDHFKRINDNHGHAAGDRALVVLSHAVQKEMRLGDTFARVGGEEFVLLLPQSDAEQSLQVAERLRRMIEELEIDAGDALVMCITSSFGVATLSPEVDGVDALYMAADAAMYRAKEAGRNCVVAFKPPAYSS